MGPGKSRLFKRFLKTVNKNLRVMSYICYRLQDWRSCSSYAGNGTDVAIEGVRMRHLERGRIVLAFCKTYS